MNLISSIQWWHTIQHSLPSWTSSYHLKLQLCSRQIAQHISWSQGCSTSPLISESILWTSTPVWTVPDIVFLNVRVPRIYYSSSSDSKLHSLKYIIFSSNSLLFIKNAAFHLLYSLIHTLLYSHIRSNLLKYFTFLSLLITSPINSNGVLSFIVYCFNFL